MDFGSCDPLVGMFTCRLIFFFQSLIFKLLLTGTEEHLNASTETYTSVSRHGNDDDQSSRSPEAQGEELDKLDDYSGNFPPTEVSAVSEELGTSVDTPVVDGDAVTVLTLAFVSVTPPTPSLKAELSSSEIITLVPDASVSTAILEDLQEVGSILRTTHSNNNKRERDEGEGSTGSSGESEEEVTSVILLAADHAEEQDETTTLIPHQTLTMDWKPESSSPSSSTFSSTPSASLSSSPNTFSPSSGSRGSYPDDESSAEPPATEESDHVTQERHVEITTRSIRSCEEGL